MAGVQATPDFSGRWILVAPEQSPPDTPRALSVRQSLAFVNLRGEPVRPFFSHISVEREFATGTRSETREIGIIGGFVSGVAGNGQPAGPPRTHFAVRWDGHALVFEDGRYTGDTAETGAWAERREVWSLDPDGRLRVTTTTRGSADVSGTTVTLIYRRR